MPLFKVTTASELVVFVPENSNELAEHTAAFAVRGGDVAITCSSVIPLTLVSELPDGWTTGTIPWGGGGDERTIGEHLAVKKTEEVVLDPRLQDIVSKYAGSPDTPAVRAGLLKDLVELIPVEHLDVEVTADPDDPSVIVTKFRSPVKEPPYRQSVEVNLVLEVCTQLEAETIQERVCAAVDNLEDIDVCASTIKEEAEIFGNES